MRFRSIVLFAGAVLTSLLTLGLQFGLPWGCARWHTDKDKRPTSKIMTFATLLEAGTQAERSRRGLDWIRFEGAELVADRLVVCDEERGLRGFDLKTGTIEPLFTPTGLAVFNGEQVSLAGRDALDVRDPRPPQFVSQFCRARLKAALEDRSGASELAPIEKQLKAFDFEFYVPTLNGDKVWLYRQTGTFTLEPQGGQIIATEFHGNGNPPARLRVPDPVQFVVVPPHIYFWHTQRFGETWFCANPWWEWVPETSEAVDPSIVSALTPVNVPPPGWSVLSDSGALRWYWHSSPLLVLNGVPTQVTLRVNIDDPNKWELPVCGGELQFLLERWPSDAGKPGTYRPEVSVIPIGDNWAEKPTFPDGDMIRGNGWEWVVLPTADGTRAILAAALWDGRVLIYEFEGTNLRLIMKLRGPMPELVLMQLGLLLLQAVVVPTLVLVALATFLMRIRARPLDEITAVAESAAPLGRRAVARALDLVILFLLPVALTLCNIDFPGWFDDSLDSILQGREVPLLQPVQLSSWLITVPMIPNAMLSSIIRAPVPL